MGAFAAKKVAVVAFDLDPTQCEVSAGSALRVLACWRKLRSALSLAYCPCRRPKSRPRSRSSWRHALSSHVCHRDQHGNAGDRAGFTREKSDVVTLVLLEGICIGLRDSGLWFWHASACVDVLFPAEQNPRVNPKTRSVDVVFDIEAAIAVAINQVVSGSAIWLDTDSA